MEVTMSTVFVVRQDGREGGEILCVTTNRAYSRTVACDKFLEYNKPRYDEEHQRFLHLKAEYEAVDDPYLDHLTHEPANKFAMEYPTLEAWHEARAKLGDEKFWDETGCAGYCDISVDLEEHALIP
jgi:hypothetical protein